MANINENVNSEEKGGGNAEHLLVVIVDLCNAYALSASSEDPTQAVRRRQVMLCQPVRLAKLNTLFVQ